VVSELALRLYETDVDGLANPPRGPLTHIHGVVVPDFTGSGPRPG